MCSLGIEPTTFALLTQCSIAEPQEHIIGNYNYWFIEQNFNIGASLSNIYPVFKKFTSYSGESYQNLNIPIIIFFCAFVDQTDIVFTLTPRTESRMNSLMAKIVTSKMAITSSCTGLVFPKTAPKEISTEPVQKSAFIMLQNNNYRYSNACACESGAAQSSQLLNHHVHLVALC